ncbi:MAG: LysR family transcriptional regulator [Candidatus Thermoplasmatota archaeon]|nr:LysR family transcriptional regulator [Candidatus Thermoplasmatota archaeon]
MPPTLDALAILDAIDRRGSFARAAEELGRADWFIRALTRPDVFAGVLDAA